MQQQAVVLRVVTNGSSVSGRLAERDSTAAEVYRTGPFSVSESTVAHVLTYT